MPTSLRAIASTHPCPYFAKHSRSTKGARPWLRRASAPPTRSWFVAAIALASEAQLGCITGRFPRNPENRRPGDNETVVGQRFFRPMLALADVVQPVSEFPSSLSETPDTYHELCRPPVASRFKRTNQMLGHFPYRKPSVRCRVPVSRQLFTAPEVDLASARHHNARFDQDVYSGVLGFGEGFGDAEVAGVHTELIKPSHRPSCGGVEVPLLFRKGLVKNAIDNAKGCSDSHWRPICFDDLGITREDSHAGANRSLSQVDRCNVALLQSAQRRRELRLKC